VSQSDSTSLPPSRTNGRVSRSRSCHCHEPYSPFGPNLPWFTTSTARPRTPTIRSSFTAMSQAHPLLHNTHADCTLNRPGFGRDS
jgi:hypothetical protein